MEKEFSTEALLSLASGIVLCDFGDMHEAAEWVVGHPIWTHEFAIKESNDQIRELIYEQHPQLREAGDCKCTPETVASLVAELHERFGEKLIVTKGGLPRESSPLDTLQQVAP